MTYNSLDNLKKCDEIQEKDDILEKFMADVMSSNLSDEIKSNLKELAKMNSNQNGREFRKKVHDDKGRVEERAKRDQERIGILKILEKVIKEIDIDEVYKKKEELIEDIRGRRFREGKVCPHCGCNKCWKYGKYNGKQRYKCRADECGKTFCDFTFSPMYCSKKGMDTWIEYMKCMVKGLSLRTSSEIVGINIATAFYWRHKIMDGLRENMGKGCVGGIVEIGHMIVVESIKGDKNTGWKRGMYNLGRRCGVKNKEMLIGVSGEVNRNFVICAVDRENNIIVEACNNRRIDQLVLDAVFSGRIIGGSVVCVAGNRHYRNFVEDMGLSLGRGCTRDENDDYQIGNVMGIKREINQWLGSFNGVSSKYLTNYLYWYRWMKEKKVFNLKGDHCVDNDYNVTKSLFVESHSRYTGMIINAFKKRKPMFVTAA